MVYDHVTCMHHVTWCPNVRLCKCKLGQARALNFFLLEVGDPCVWEATSWKRLSALTSWRLTQEDCIGVPSGSPFFCFPRGLCPRTPAFHFAEHEPARTWRMYFEHGTCMYYDHSTGMYYDHNTCMFYDYTKCRYYDHSTFMYYDHSACMYHDDSPYMYYDHSTCMYYDHTICM